MIFGLFGKKEPPKPRQHPQETGYVIAGALTYACTKESISPQQRESLANLKIGEDSFWCEMLSLAASSALWAIISLLQGRPEQPYVLQGFQDGWDRFISEDRNRFYANAAFIEERESYLQAELKRMRQPPGVLGDPVADQFMQLLAQEAEIDLSVMATQETSVRYAELNILTRLTVSVTSSAYFEMAAQVMAEAGLIKAPKR